MTSGRCVWSLESQQFSIHTSHEMNTWLYQLLIFSLTVQSSTVMLLFSPYHQLYLPFCKSWQHSYTTITPLRSATYLSQLFWVLPTITGEWKYSLKAYQKLSSSYLEWWIATETQLIWHLATLTLLFPYHCDIQKASVVAIAKNSTKKLL